MKNKKIFLFSFIITIGIYFTAYLLSSREAVLDIKNISLIFLFSLVYGYIYKKTDVNKYMIITFMVSIILGFTVPFLSYSSEPMFLQRLMKDFLFWYTLPLVPASLSAGIKNLKRYRFWFATITSLVYFLAILPMIVIIGYYLTFSTFISVDGIIALMQTNFYESIEFLKTYISLSLIIVIILLILTIIMLWKMVYDLKLFPTVVKLESNYFYYICFGLFLVSNVLIGMKMYWVRTVSDAYKREQLTINFEKESALRNKNLLKNFVLDESGGVIMLSS